MSLTFWELVCREHAHQVFGQFDILGGGGDQRKKQEFLWGCVDGGVTEDAFAPNELGGVSKGSTHRVRRPHLEDLNLNAF